MKTIYTVWNADEELSLCREIVARWKASGFTYVNPENYREVIQAAANGQATNEDRSVGWRPRALKARDGRYFVITNYATLENLLKESFVKTYSVPGYEHRLSAEQMQEEIGRLRASEQTLREQLAQQTQPSPHMPEERRLAPITVKAKSLSSSTILASPSLPRKVKVAIAGVHDKHRDAIVKAFPNLNITWIEPRDNDSMIKSKASSHPSIACTHGTNGKVLKLLSNVSSKFFQVGGAHGVRAVLASAAFH